MFQVDDTKVYYIDTNVRCCYPYECDRVVKDYGVLKRYILKKYTRAEMDRLLARLMVKHPYVSGAMHLELTVYCIRADGRGPISTYHHLTFKNDFYAKQSRENEAIQYEVVTK